MGFAISLPMKGQLWARFSNDDLGLDCTSETNREHFFLQDFGFWKGQTWLSESVVSASDGTFISCSQIVWFADKNGRSSFCLIWCRIVWNYQIQSDCTHSFRSRGVQGLSGRQSCVYRMQLIQSQNCIT